MRCASGEKREERREEDITIILIQIKIVLEDPQWGNTFETLTYVYHILGPSFPEFIWIWGPVQAIQQIPSKDVCPKTCKSNHMGEVLHYHVNHWLLQISMLYIISPPNLTQSWHNLSSRGFKHSGVNTSVLFLRR